MPTSRKRSRLKRRRQGVRRSPYESLIRGVQADERLAAWYERASWSFHRAPFPVDPDPVAHDTAIARAFEWFLFDLVLPDSHRTPAEEWIAVESQRQRWSAPVMDRYLRFTRGEYGLFEVTKGPLPTFVLRQIETDRVVHAVMMDDWLIPQIGQIVAARLFPVEDAGAQPRDREIFELSPGSDVLPPLKESALLQAIEHGALGVEALYGANPDWLGEAIATGALGRLTDAFLSTVSGGGVAVVDLQQELRELDDPDGMIEALNLEIAPLTPEEPALLGALIASLWILTCQQAGASDKTVRKLAKAWQRKLVSKLPIQPRLSAPSLFTPAEDAMWQLSEHEVARLRSIPLAADVQWVGRRRQVRVPIYEEGKLPEYPDVILWHEQPSGLMMSATVVPVHEPSSAMLKTIVGAMSQPGPGTGGLRRPARVFVQSQTVAARLSRALAPLGIDVQLRYVEPDMNELFADLEERSTRDLPGDVEGIRSPEARYLRLPGTTPRRAERLFAAAAEFYRAAPWRLLADDVLINLEFPVTRRTSGPPMSHALAAIMGKGGQTFGLALYFNPSDLVSVQLGADVEDGLHFDALSVVFTNEAGTEPATVAEIREQGWPVADRRAFPTALRTSPDAPPRLVAGEELELAAAALDAVREFVAHHGSALRSTARSSCRDDIVVAGFGRVRVSIDPPAPEEPPY